MEAKGKESAGDSMITFATFMLQRFIVSTSVTFSVPEHKCKLETVRQVITQSFGGIS